MPDRAYRMGPFVFLVRAALLLLLLLPCPLPAQRSASPAVQPFDVASIRPHNPALPGTTIKIPSHGEMSVSGMTARELIRFAYDIRQDYQLSGGPKWIESDKYDIRAKTSEEDPPASSRNSLDNQRIRMQLLLADRFGLKLRHETRQSSVYFLTAAKTGLKLQSATNGAYATDKGAILPWTLVVADLSTRVERPVVDKTNLTGPYYVKLRYSDIYGKPNGIGLRSDQLDPNDPGPSIFTAIQEQLGLRLDSGKAPIEVLVIDSINRPSLE